MKLVARISARYQRLYETCRLILERYKPKPKIRVREYALSREVPWYSGDDYPCELCPWELMRWDEELLGWYCTSCGQHYHPRVDITEERPVVRPPTPILTVEKAPGVKPAFRTGQLS